MKKKAKLVIHSKDYFEDKNFIETKIWEVPKSKDKPYGFKYSLVYIENDIRVIGYDNCEEKGEHKHYLNSEEGYNFKNIDSLFEDFIKDVRRYRNED